MDENTKNDQSATWAVAGILLLLLILGIAGAVWYSVDRSEESGRACAELILDGRSADDC